MYIDAPLPGMEPGYFRIEVTHASGAYFDLRVTAAQDPRYISAADITLYAALSAAEMWDVLSATLDAFGA